MSEDGNSRTVAREGGDVGSPSKHSTSRKRIKILPPKLGGNSTTVASQGGNSSDNYSTPLKRVRFRPDFEKSYFRNYLDKRRRPRFPLFYCDGRCSKEKISGLVGAALSSFNESYRGAHEDPLYELVEVLGGIYTPESLIYHFNFIAKPINGTDAENMLFFAEVKKGRIDVPKCNCCYILGPPGTVTGHDCGLYCFNYGGHVQHPEGGFAKTIIRVLKDIHGCEIMDAKADRC